MAITGPGASPLFDKNKRNSPTLAQRAAPAPVIPAPVLSEEERAKKEQDLKDQDIANKKKALEARKRQKDMVIQAIPHSGSHDGGAIGKAEHLAGLTAEGVAGEIIADLMIFAVELTFNTPFWVQTLQFEQAVQRELASVIEGNPVRLAYLPDDNGDYPVIYPIDNQGKVDFSQAPMRTYKDDGSLSDYITPFHIRANGYVPKPSVTESFKIVFDRHLERMQGSGVLTPEQKARMSGTVSGMQSDNKENESDLASDAASQRFAAAAAQAAAKPRPV